MSGIHYLDFAETDAVGACYTTRYGGISLPPFDSFNLGDHVNDDPEAVQANRSLLAAQTQSSPIWLKQVHGTDVLRLDADTPQGIAVDASWTDVPGLGCAIMTADCLPVLFYDPETHRVGAAHAGWRGLVNGVLEQTLEKMGAGSSVYAWLGACIGPEAFQVGEEVRQACLQSGIPEAGQAISADALPNKWRIDLQQLAASQLEHLGVQSISRLPDCTFSSSEKFFSYRRTPVTGRQVSMIWLKDI